MDVYGRQLTSTNHTYRWGEQKPAEQRLGAPHGSGELSLIDYSWQIVVNFIDIL